MCLINLYLETVSDDNKLFTDIARFEIDLEKKMLRVYSLLGELKEYGGVKRVAWREDNDSMVIEMDGGSGSKFQANI